MTTASGIATHLDAWLPKSVIALRTYDRTTFRHDLLAGITVGLVALPLAMAFAIASGLTPQAGIYCAIVTGFLISALGGSKVQIGGPTGAFVVVVAGHARVSSLTAEDWPRRDSRASPQAIPNRMPQGTPNTAALP